MGFRFWHLGHISQISNICLGSISGDEISVDDNCGVEQMLFHHSVSYDYTALTSADVRWGKIDLQHNEFKLRDERQSFIEFMFDIPCHVQVCYVCANLSHSGSMPGVAVNLYVNEKLLKENCEVSRSNSHGIPSKFLKKGENWFKIWLNTGVYFLWKITITYTYMHPDDITYMGENDTTTTVLKSFDFRQLESGAIFKSITISDSDRPEKKYAEFSEPGESSIVMNFDVSDYKSICRIKLTLNHCRASEDGVVDIFVNDFPLRVMYSLTPRDIFEEETFIIGKRFFKSGSNTATIFLAAESQGSYWLSHAVLEGVHIPMRGGLEGVLLKKSNTLVRDLMQLFKTRRQVIDTFMKIAREASSKN